MERKTCSFTCADYNNMKKSLIFFLCIASVTCAIAQTDYQVISTKTERDVIPEGITINPADGKIYVSSIALKKIIAIDSTGAHEDFIKSNQNGFLEGLGMKIDTKKQWLWVVSNQKKGKVYQSHVHAFDLRTKSVKQKYEINDTLPHLLNDLTLHANGKVFITDTFGSAVYEVDPAKHKLNLFLHDAKLDGANGIVTGEDGKIFIAARNGLLQLNHRSKKVTPLTFIDSKKALWMDGIVYWNNSIIGVTDDAIMQYQLNATGDTIVTERIVAKKNPFFHEPTTAALLANKLYLVANSNLAAYNENNESVKGIEDKLNSVVVLVYKLKPLD